MKKRLFLLIVLVLTLVLIGCGDTDVITPPDVNGNETNNDKESIIIKFYYDDEVISEIEYLSGMKVNYPLIEVDEGYYIEWDKEIPSSINSNMEFKAELREKTKEYTYMLDDKVMDVITIPYHLGITHVYDFFYEEGVERYDESEEYLGEENNVYKYVVTYTKVYKTFIVKFLDEDGNVLSEEVVEYGKSAHFPDSGDGYVWEDIDLSSIKGNLEVRREKVKTEYSITYYDGTSKINLKPRTYKAGEETTLPTLEKEGYEFVGWFVSNISLYPYTKIDETTSGDITLYARYIETVTHKPIRLPEATARIPLIKKVAHSSGNGTYVYQPQIPDGMNTSVTNYTWTSSDETVATISAYSSITGKKAGCAIITGTLNSDQTVTINCIIRVTGDGIIAVSEAEANQINLHTVTFLGFNDELIKVGQVVDGGSILYPIPEIIEGYRFVGWDKDNYNIKEDVTIKAMYEVGINNYTGKKFSVIGDSISTFQGYIPQGYACFYPYPTADVADYNMTWWMMAVNKLGAGLFINNSYSGSCAASSTGASASSNPERLKELVVNNETPDVVLIFMGSNDCGSKYVTLDQFASGYEETITKTKELCKNAEIVLCTLPVSRLYTNENRLEYNEVIKGFALKYNLKVCDLGEVDITSYLIDSAHPNTNGMEVIANKIVEDLLK